MSARDWGDTPEQAAYATSLQRCVDGKPGTPCAAHRLRGRTFGSRKAYRVKLREYDARKART